jgi:hypothetical protein
MEPTHTYEYIIYHAMHDDVSSHGWRPDHLIFASMSSACARVGVNAVRFQHFAPTQAHNYHMAQV